MYLLTKVMLIMWTKDLRQSSIRFLKGPIHQKLIAGLSDLHRQIPGSRGTDIRILLFMVAVLCNIVRIKIMSVLMITVKPLLKMDLKRMFSKWGKACMIGHIFVFGVFIK